MPAQSENKSNAERLAEVERLLLKARIDCRLVNDCDCIFLMGDTTIEVRPIGPLEWAVCRCIEGDCVLDWQGPLSDVLAGVRQVQANEQRDAAS